MMQGNVSNNQYNTGCNYADSDSPYNYLSFSSHISAPKVENFASNLLALSPYIFCFIDVKNPIEP